MDKKIQIYKIGTLVWQLYKIYGRGVIVYQKGHPLIYSHPSFYDYPQKGLIETYNPAKEFCLYGIIEGYGTGFFTVTNLDSSWGTLTVGSHFFNKFAAAKNVKTLGFSTSTPVDNPD